MSKFVAGHVTKMWFLKWWISSFRTQILHLNFKEKCWRDDVVTFTAHLSVTIKRLTRYEQKVVLAAMLDGILNMAANTNHTALLKNYSAIKYLTWMPFLSNFGSKIIFMCSVNFWHQQDSNSLFKGSFDHVTSKCKWPILMNKSNTFDQQRHSRSLSLSHQGYLQGLQLSPPFAAKLYQWMEKFCVLLLKGSGNLKNHLLTKKSR